MKKAHNNQKSSGFSTGIQVGEISGNLCPVTGLVCGSRAHLQHSIDKLYVYLSNYSGENKERNFICSTLELTSTYYSPKMRSLEVKWATNSSFPSLPYFGAHTSMPCICPNIRQPLGIPAGTGLLQKRLWCDSVGHSVWVTGQQWFAMSQTHSMDYGDLFPCKGLPLFCHRSINLRWQSRINSARSAVYFSGFSPPVFRNSCTCT